MRKLIAAIAVMALVSTVANAAYSDDSLTNNISGYVQVASGWAATNTVTDLGLTTNTVYACIPIASLYALTEATSTEASSWRNFVYHFSKAQLDAYEAMATTNRPSRMTATESIRTSTAADIKASYTLDFDVDIISAPVVADE